MLQNNIKPVRKLLQNTHLRSIDYDSTLVRYAPNADATPLHICAQFGFVAMAKMLVNEFRLGTNHRNKVGSTPLHVACRCGQASMISWLVDEVQVPLDIPDGQQRIAFDLAPFDVIDKCVLVPLRTQLGKLRRTEEELLQQNQQAQENLVKAQRKFRRRTMVLNDSEAHAERERENVEIVSAVERHWYEQLQSKEVILKGLENEYDRLQQILEAEQANAELLFDREVRDVQDQNAGAKAELQALQTLVENTQRELDRRKQLLVDQLGVFDAALIEFPGSKEVQQWVLATLTAIVKNNDADKLDKHLLLLRAEPVEIVRHILTTFPTDYSLHVEAVGLLVTIQHIHVNCDPTSVMSVPFFVTAVVETDLLLVLGETLGRWFAADQSKRCPSDERVCRWVLEAMYMCLRLARNAQRALALCQRKHLQLLPLQAFAVFKSPSERRHIALLLLTFVQYGVKKALLRNGIVRTVFTWLREVTMHACTSEDEHAATVETAQNLFATLALLTALPSPAKRQENSTLVELHQLEDVAADCDSFSALAVVGFLRCYVGKPDEAVAVSMWAFKLLLNFVQHGGHTARRLREEMLGQHGFGCFPVVEDTLKLALTADGNTQAVQAAFDLVQAVWVERFDKEGQLLPTHFTVLNAMADATVAYAEELVINSNRLPDLADGLKALSRAAANPLNADELAKRALQVETTLVQPVLYFIIRHVDETRRSYREPVLIQLLLHILKLFLHVSHARLRAQQPALTDSFTRDLHNTSREIGICTVLKALKNDLTHGSSQCPPDPMDWTTLKALSTQLADLVHCTC